MKKKKLSILLNIATICLCVCAIAIGVYSVKNASLSVTGTVAFTAHDCKVDVTAYIYGDAVDSSNTASSTGTPRTEANKAQLDTWSGVTDKTGSQTIDSSKSFYFSDMGESGEVEDITIVFTITNQSDFPVKAVIDNATSSTSSITFTDAGDFGVPASAGTISGTMPAKSNTCNLAIKLKLSNSTKTSNAYSISLSFEKYTPASLSVSTASDFRQYASLTEYTNISRSYVNMGKVAVYDDTTYENVDSDLRWYIFAKSNSSTGAMEPVTGALSSTTLSAGTYWFISEYALGSQCLDEGYNNVYNESDMKQYLADGFLSTYITDANTNEVYNEISLRTLKDDNNGDLSVDTFITTENQKLWPLSITEASYLAGTKMTSNLSSGNLISKFMTNNFASCTWWTRSPSTTAEDNAWCVSDGQFCDWYTANTSAVRPAFQIVI